MAASSAAQRLEKGLVIEFSAPGLAALRAIMQRARGRCPGWDGTKYRSDGTTLLAPPGQRRCAHLARCHGKGMAEALVEGRNIAEARIQHDALIGVPARAGSFRMALHPEQAPENDMVGKAGAFICEELPQIAR